MFYYDTLHPDQVIEIYNLIESMKDDFTICYPDNIHLKDLFILHSNRLVDTMHDFITTPDQYKFYRLVRYFDSCISFSDRTIKTFIEMFILNMELLIQCLLKVEYYEVMGKIERMMEMVSEYFEYYQREVE